MEGERLEPWMLQADWRAEMPAYLVVDLASWPDDLDLDPLPPVPLIGLGARDHPQAHRVDALAEPELPPAALALTMTRCPRAAATLVQLLRATASLAADDALTAESFAYAMLQGGREHHLWREARTPGPIDPGGAVIVSRAGNRLEVRLDRPAARNAIDRAMRDALFDAFSVAAIDRTIEAVRLTGEGRCFSMGADLTEFGTTTDPAEAHAVRMRTLPARALARRPDIYEVHVQGGCVGSGLELAAFAPRLTASPDAWFQLPEIGMGILPGAGGCVSLPRRIGRQRAAALMLSGKRIGAATALRWGLVDAIMDEAPGDQGGADPDV
ncbi:enoyl-CoA hydratase/isomerase family protein [Sphingomonas sp. BIUV-7]|uniref:Enoyl-CoA hydratase/isomerase family protein n=1 Tax=Sphingomonas natans TaxID=3063330 RepID=A0ABT8Y8C8_9SPHN|nr:enoyl-CoA hydratase/isomerase family protein [Sphingomonas sp. BIUV-7]MDO6414586.1 enoyl-CoA hydratase/isomerase family protein [Sphingomonas sp. BIUV-7]